MNRGNVHGTGEDGFSSTATASLAAGKGIFAKGEDNPGHEKSVTQTIK
jgi:hypothetical protein